jgi:hypothetical protein
MEGFTDEEIAKAVDYCDNDKVKTMKHLAKLKEKGAGYNWKPEVEKILPGMDAQMKGLCQKLLAYDNVPIKQKTFVNFAKNSLALMRQPQLADKMWELIGPLLKKPETASAAKEPDQVKEEEHVADEEAPKPKKKKEKTASAVVEVEDEGKKKKKKDKSSTEHASAVDEQEASTADPDAATEIKPKKKKSRAEVEPTEEVPAPSGEEKKKKKKKKNQEAQEDDDSPDTPQADAAAVGDKRDRSADVDAAEPKKKSKKQKDAAADAGATATGASRFDFYKESKAVKAASAAEVLKHRQSLDIKVRGGTANERGSTRGVPR